MARKKVKRKTSRGRAENQLEYPTDPTTFDIMTKMSGTKKNPIGERHELFPNLNEMIEHIQSVTPKQAEIYANLKNTPPAGRSSLAVFVVDWAKNDINHEMYLENTPKGFDKAEALKMGDLLYWCITGGTVRQGWEKIIQKQGGLMEKLSKKKGPKLPQGLKLQDLIGLHIELLNMLPQKSYNAFTLNQLFLENRPLYDSLFDNFIKLSPMEHDSLQVLTKLVESGNIERFRLAMLHGAQTKVRSMLKDGTFGANLLDAFETARKATEAYNRGEYDEAQSRLDELQQEYGVSPDMFQLGLGEMFVIHAGTVVRGTKGGGGREKNQPLTFKGSNIPLLVSVDKSVGPKGGWPGLKRVRNAMMSSAKSYDNNGGITATAAQYGTGGGRVFKSKSGDTVLSTDWLWLFAILNTKKGLPKNLSDGLDITKSGDERTVRLLIHSRLDKGFEDLVPKGLLTVTLRPYQMGSTQTLKTSRRAAKSNHGKKKKGKGEQRQDKKPEAVKMQKWEVIGKAPHIGYIGTIDLIFEDYGGLFSTEEKKAGGTHRDKNKTTPQVLDAADAESGQEMLDQMQPDELSGIDESEIFAPEDDAASLLSNPSRCACGCEIGKCRCPAGCECGCDHKKGGAKWAKENPHCDCPKGKCKCNPPSGLRRIPPKEFTHDLECEQCSWEGSGLRDPALRAPDTAFRTYAPFTEAPVWHCPECNKPLLSKWGTAKKNAPKGAGKSSMGQTIAIELTPKAQIKPSTAREDAGWLKMIVKRHSDLLKPLYNKYARKTTASKTQKTTRVKKGSKMGEGVTGGKDGSYLVYKGGQAQMRMIKAKRKDTGQFVPWMIFIPHILVRHGNEDKLESKKGGDGHKRAKKLLEEIERYFGTPKFQKNLGMGGLRLISERTARKMGQKPSGGKRVKDLAVHEGVKKVFTTPGLPAPQEGMTTARPAYYKPSGDIVYRSRDQRGKEFHFQQKVNA